MANPTGEEMTQEPPGEIERQLVSMDKELNLLDTVITTLGENIEPIMSGERPSAAADEKAKGAQCPLAQQLHDYVGRVKVAKRRIISLTERIEL